MDSTFLAKNSEEVYEYVIIGGGIAGLAALHKLKKDGKNVILLEKETEVGGHVKTKFEDGILIESGPNAYLKNYEYVNIMIDELGLRDSVVNNLPGATNRYLVKNGKLVALPENPFSFLLSNFLTLKGKLRLFFEPLTKIISKEEESIYNFAVRHFGKEVAENVMDAAMSGICAGDIKKLDMYSLFPKVKKIEKEYGSILLFLMKFKKKHVRKKRGVKELFTSLKGGMGMLPVALAAKYKDSIRTDFEVGTIYEQGPGYIITSRTRSITAKKLILATPAFVASDLIKPFLSETASYLKRIIYTKMVIINLAFKTEDIPHPMNGFGFLISRTEGLRPIGGLFSSTLFENRAPEGISSFKVYMGGEYDLKAYDLSEAEVIDCVKKEILPMLSIEGESVYMEVKKIRSAIPQYNLGHHKNVELITSSLEAKNNVFLIGNYLTGISVNEAIKSGITFEG